MHENVLQDTLNFEQPSKTHKRDRRQQDYETVFRIKSNDRVLQEECARSV